MTFHQPIPLTNEELCKQYANPFELINTAIERAYHMLDKDRHCMVPTMVQNRAYQVLLEMREGIDPIATYVEEKREEYPREKMIVIDDEV